MSGTYRFKSLTIAEKADGQETPKDSDLTSFTTGTSKTIDFKFKDGTRQSFTYGYLINMWFGIEDKYNVIKLFFTTHLVTIHGYCLDTLYNYLVNHTVKTIIEHDERYINIMDDSRASVSHIIVE